MIEEIRRSFGAKYINTDGTLNRRLLGAKVFKDPTSRRLLEDLTHPVLRKELLVLVSAARRTGQDTVLDHPLLFEMKMETYRSEEHTSELQSRPHLVCRLLLEKKNKAKEI